MIHGLATGFLHTRLYLQFGNANAEIKQCLNKKFEDLRPARGESDSLPTWADDYQLAMEQIDAVYNKGGKEYAYVCQRCLKCEFGVLDSEKRLDIETFRSLVYDGVVGPLEDDYERFSK